MTSYVGTEPFISYCAQLCNFCQATTKLPTTTSSSSNITSTHAPSNGTNTTPYVCQDMDPQICANSSTSYCLSMSYIGKKNTK